MIMGWAVPRLLSRETREGDQLRTRLPLLPRNRLDPQSPDHVAEVEGASVWCVHIVELGHRHLPLMGQEWDRVARLRNVPVSIFPTDVHKSSPFGRMEPISNTECRGRWVKKALSVQLCGFSVLPGGRNPWKKQAVFRNDLGEVQEIPCSSFNFPEPLLKSQIL